ncbi:MAG TPA: SCE4755 family polysaccharide monooxygenase-like protein [Polyangiaceae bacterium]|nr:SCE4755 family polysaccharide monooxygenase-like protein [Polyangiaceae bacterium]
MRSVSASLISGGAAAALFLTASTVFAHIDLLSPAPRYPVNRANGGGGSKECPCGGTAVDPDRKCNVTADQSHDPNRSSNVTPFEAGSTITIRMEEYINHSGRFRVAFDPDGADLTDFNSNVLLDVADDKGTQVYEFQVKLPDMICDNCTLQVIQDMNGNTTTPVRDPAPDATYYTCADIRLVAPGTMGTDEGTDPPDGDPSDDGDGMMMPGATPPANDGSMGTDGAASGSNMGGNLGTVPMMGDNRGSTTPGMTGSGTGVANNGTTTGVGSLMPGMNTGNGNTLQPSNGAPIMSGASESEESGGCSFSGRSSASPFAALAMAGMATALFARRRRQK